MGEVKRWFPCENCGSAIMVHAEGEPYITDYDEPRGFVRDADYTALERERDECRRAFERAEADVQVLVRERDKLEGALEREQYETARQAEELTRLRAVEAAALKLISCKGRFHTEQNYNALAEACGRKP